FLTRHGDPRPLPSFPTRRSSDLARDPQREQAVQADGVEVRAFEPVLALGRAAATAGDEPAQVGVASAILDQQHQLEAVVEAELRSEEHTSELQSRENLVCRLLLE